MKKQEHDEAEHLLQFFEWQHLPIFLQSTSERFRGMAVALFDDLPPSPERTMAIRKLLEAKDCAVRAKLASAR